VAFERLDGSVRLTRISARLGLQLAQIGYAMAV
jgi:hypothetical protein